MKTIFYFLLLVGAVAFAESGPDNGTDYVKILFADARESLIEATAPIHVGEIQNMDLDADVKAWLTAKDNRSNAANIEALKSYLRIIELRFQESPCLDSLKRQSSICFQFDSGGPGVLISLQQNRLTTRPQAMAMLVHEAGHFLGQMDHLFLDRVGVQLVSHLNPGLIRVNRTSKEASANVFSAKEACENGTSAQARNLFQVATLDLKEKCTEQKARCDLNKMEHVFTGEVEWIEGQGYTMSVICNIRLQAPIW